MNPFAAWLDRHSISYRRAAEILGCSRNSVLTWKNTGAPRYILLACAAFSVGLDPIR